MRRLTTRAVFATFVAIAPLLLLAPEANAATGYEFPENGTEQLGRAGAWVARASNPLATYFNPAGLAGQQSGVALNLSLIWQKTCLQRKLPNGQVAGFGGDAYRYPEEVCNTDSGTPFPNPQLALAWHVTDKLGLGFAVMGPSTRGKFEWPLAAEGVWVSQNVNRELPSPQRYLLVKDDLLYIWPQIGVGYEVMDDLRIGASFIWGIARLKFSVAAAGLATSQPNSAGFPVDEYQQDVTAALDVTDLFVPGFTLGSLYSPTPWLDVAAWFHWMDDIKAKGDATIVGPIYGTNGRQTSDAARTTTTTTGDKATMTAPWPMQIRVGARWHMPRGDEDVPATKGPDPAGAPQYRDPIAHDEWDVELDITWANNSSFEELSAGFAPGVSAAITQDTVPPTQLTLQLPEDASIPHHWKNAWGFRLGGDYVIAQDRLAVRAGGFFQTEAQDPKYLHIDYVPSQLFGFTAGLTVRLGSLDLLAAYGHVFFKGLDNGGEGSTLGLAGSSPFRTVQAVNGGSNSSAVNVVSAGATYRF